MGMRRPKSNAERYGANNLVYTTTLANGRRQLDVGRTQEKSSVARLENDPGYQERVQELKGYGVEVGTPRRRNPNATGIGRFGANLIVDPTNEKVMNETRTKAIQTQQKEELTRQKQELKTSAAVARRRAGGRGSLVNQLPRMQTMGAAGTLG